MMKKHVECNEYNIIMKESQNDTLSIHVNGEEFILIVDMSISETDEDKVIEFIEKEYEHWAFNWPHKFNKFKFMKDDGTTCRDSKS